MSRHARKRAAKPPGSSASASVDDAGSARRVFDDDGREVTPRPLGGRSIGAEATTTRERADARAPRPSLTPSVSAFGTVLSETSETTSAECAIGQDALARRDRGRGSRGERERASTIEIVRADGSESESSSDDDGDARARDLAYLARVEDRRAARVRVNDASAQTLGALRFDAHALTERIEREVRVVQADEFDCDRDDDDSVNGASSSRAPEIRVNVLRAMESALRERERLEYCLKYRGLRPSDDDASALSALTILTCEQTRGMNVSSVKLNPVWGDLVCVAYGEFSFAGANRETREKGALAFWSIRSEAPLCVLRLESGVMSIDWSRRDPNLLAVGCYDGEVFVYDVGEFVSRDGSATTSDSTTMTTTTRRGQITSSEQRHSDPVWAVTWVAVKATDGFEDEENVDTVTALVSASTDGKVMRWDLRDGLYGTEVLAVRWSPPGVENDGAVSSKASETRGGDLVQHSGVMCLDFSSDAKYYVVGTEEGKIHKCSLSYSDQYLASYASHVGPVYAIKFNPFHERVFVTCSADWTVRVFLDDTQRDDDAFASIDEASSRLKASSLIQPRVVIEYSQQPINAVDWSPWCATEFALVTDAGTIEIWDLASSTVVPKYELSITDDKTAAVSLTYAHDAPVILVGCASGSTHVLRMKWRDPTEGIAAKETQRERLEDVLSASIKS